MYQRALLLVFLITFGAALLPSHAEASSGFIVWSGTGTQFANSYWSKLVTDARNHGGVTVPVPDTPYVSADMFGIFASNNGGGGPQNELGISTMNRICEIIDSPNGKAATWDYDGSWYGSNGDAPIVDFSGSSWAQDKAGDNGCPGGGDGCHYSFTEASSLTCTDSSILPTQTLTIDKTTMKVGDPPATLTFNDTAAIDDESETSDQYGISNPWPTNPDPAQDAAGTPQPPVGQQGYIESSDCTGDTATTNATFASNAICVPTNASGGGAVWSNAETRTGSWQTSFKGGSCGSGSEGVYFIHFYTWQNTGTSQAELKSGTYQVSPTSPGTYTYNYLCTNINGSTLKSVTLTVTGGSALPDYVVPNAPTVIGTTTPGNTVTFTTSVTNNGGADATSSSNVRIQVEAGTTIDGNATNFDSSDLPIPPLTQGQNSGNVSDSAWSYTIPSTANVGDPYSYRACADMPPAPYGNIGEGTNTGETNNCGPISTLYVTQPDLIMNNVTYSPSSVYVNTPVTLYATTTNQGGAGTGFQFHNVFEINPTVIPTQFSQILKVKYPDTDPADHLDADDDNEGIQLSTWQFPSNGLWYVRACANTDKNDASSTAFTESDWNDNNCSQDQGDGNLGWTPITVTYPPATCTINANPNPVQNGQPTTLSWTSTNATTCQCAWQNNGNGASCGTTGTDTATPTTNPTDYSMVCQDPAGVNGTPCDVSVAISSSCGQNASGTVTATKPRVPDDTTDGITWTGTGITGPCWMYGPNVGGNGVNRQSVSVNQCNIYGNASPNITAQSSYALVCNSAGLSTSTVDVIPNYNEF